MHRFVVDTHKDYVTGLPRSLYHAVDRLVRDELIAAVQTSREGRRPERTVYELTDEGRAELATRLRRLLEQVGPDSLTFTAAISLMGCLPKAEVERALRVRAAPLEGRVVAADAKSERAHREWAAPGAPAGARMRTRPARRRARLGTRSPRPAGVGRDHLDRQPQP
ncbi:helix-turn-helix transcriptional regulator [Streptosporangium sp. NPDC005286]|uniref:PadR family transcriptional regulator n=1 Tax=Streptosporangium sp. NPDC005286 TaxID=3154463 RepID=UPI0033BC6F95